MRLRFRSPRFVDSHGFYVYEVDVSARLMVVNENGPRVTPKNLVEAEDGDFVTHDVSVLWEGFENDSTDVLLAKIDKISEILAERNTRAAEYIRRIHG